ncbi:MAG: hypothetical protein JOZ78_21910 [Chroococcidiopsidaceae cyanobacterium CP_BM_ER_R8_30]|nr:hypothetical protein [Chroococcidiopsidaceae cyanobacterium CP_BM_ER_R8_30]
MEGSGSSSSQVSVQIGLAFEETTTEVPLHSHLAVYLMDLPVLTLF